MRERARMAAGAAGCPWRQTTGRAALRTMVLDFLALNENPTRWTFYRGLGGIGDGRDPDIILDVRGRIAYIDVQRQGGGGLARVRKAQQVLACRRGALCFTVRSVPDMENVLHGLGVALKPKGRLMQNPANVKPQQGR